MRIFSRSKKKDEGTKAPASAAQTEAKSEAFDASLLSRPGYAAAVLVWSRRDFQHRITVLTRIALAEAGAIVGLTALVAILALQGPRFRFFATQPNGSLIQLVPLSKPIMSSADLGNWVAEHVSQAFTMSWTSYRQDQMRASHAFTRAGWQSYLRGVQNAKIIKLITNEQVNMTAAVTAAPVLVNTGHLGNGNIWWDYQFPMVWTYNAGTGSPIGTHNQSVVVTVRVVRVPQTESPKGVLVAQIIARRST